MDTKEGEEDLYRLARDQTRKGDKRCKQKCFDKQVKVGLHQGSALSPFLFAMLMDRLTDESRQVLPWTMIFADDIVICS